MINWKYQTSNFPLILGKRYKYHSFLPFIKIRTLFFFVKSLFFSDFKCSTWSWTAVLQSWSLGKGFGLSRNVCRRKRSHGSWIRCHQKTVDHQWKIFKKITKWKSSNCFSGWTFHLPMCCSVSYLHCLDQHQLKNFVKSKFPNS